MSYEEQIKQFPNETNRACNKGKHDKCSGKGSIKSLRCMCKCHVNESSDVRTNQVSTLHE